MSNFLTDFTYLPKAMCYGELINQCPNELPIQNATFTGQVVEI